MKKSILAIIAGVSCVIICIVISIFIVVFGLTTNNSEEKQDTENSNSTQDSNIDENDEVSQSSVESYDCLFSSNDNITKISAYEFDIVVSDIPDAEVDWGEIRPDNGVREIDLEEFISNNSDDKIYFSAKKDNGSILEDFDMQIQACDLDNNTTQFGYLSDKTTNPYSSEDSGESYLSTMQLSSFQVKETPEKYRLDAIIYYNGAWQLVDRIDQIEFK